MAKGGVRTTTEDVTSLIGTRYKTCTHAPNPTQKIDRDRVHKSTENIYTTMYRLLVVAKDDIKEAAANTNLCVGQGAAVEALFRYMQEVFARRAGIPKKK